MNPMSVTKRMTDRVPRPGFDGVRSELVEGEMIVAEPRLTDQLVSCDIWRVLDGWTWPLPAAAR